MTPVPPRPAPASRRAWADLLPSRRDYAGLRSTWRRDLVAGLTVGVVALPLALAFGVSSGMGAAAGLVTAIVAGIVAAVMGGSPVQVSGPTGAMAVVLAPIVAANGADAVVVVSIMAGLILVVAGIARLGRVVSYIPWPVIEGFTVGIAVIIFLQQVPLALDMKATAGVGPLPAAWDAVRHVDWSTSAWALGTVAVTALVIEGLRRVDRRIPGSLVAVVLTTVVAQLLSLDVWRIGALPHSLPLPGLPSVDVGSLPSLVRPAVAVAALAAIESLLSARVAAGMMRTGRVQADREVLGQGLASIASGLFGGMPATGAIARTAVNVRAGATSRLAAVIHALVLLAVVAFAAPIAGWIPLSCLAGVLMVTAVRMVDLTEVRALVRVSTGTAATFAVTVACTVMLDLITAVEVGIAIAAFLSLRALSSMTHVTRERLPGPPQPGDDAIAVLRVEGSLFFGAAERIMEDIADLRGVKVIVIRLSRIRILDPTGAHRLAELVRMLESRGVTVILKGLRSEHSPMARSTGVLEALRHSEHNFDHLYDAVAHARTHALEADRPGRAAVAG